MDYYRNGFDELFVKYVIREIFSKENLFNLN